MDSRMPVEAAHRNAAGFWLARARALGLPTRTAAGWTAVRAAPGGADAHRLVVTRPYGDAAALAGELAGLVREWGAGQACVEDPYGGLDLAPFGFEAAIPQPVMMRQPDASAPGNTCRAAPANAPRAAPRTADGTACVRRDAVEVREAVDGAALADAERVVAEGFPLTGRLPWRSGALLPEALLREPGWRAWRADRGGVPAGACVSFDDGSAVGLYWVATLPAHRSRGVARALVRAVLDAHPGRTAVLTSTLLGEPLYRRAGFTERGLSRWWRHPASPPALAPAVAPAATGR
ncbi:GNAT family N-acetyltransferase [Streptacidiphilus sp. ASG 303]|uniref:GNAT family N-acetyltransferase n=1 Tax=Streptacidiphilus sp. ASG 303 TaxID=2896847 RepID=UPI001E5AC7B9|nr:GNAT family N-acetyltransferase [Streptacidiphilus sp. ASG 303]MCD0483340.1 GNAT family N-acetyltransferase [Streptacidiphilus sp. ASG 303]